nr:MAG TPA: hypothetical protein [Microviridae sp.]
MEKRYKLYYYYPGKRIYQDVVISAKSFAIAYKEAQAFLKKARANFAMLYEEESGTQIIKFLDYE